MEITPIVIYIGVVFSFLGLLSLDLYHFDFLMSLKETVWFPSLSNPVLLSVREDNSSLIAFNLSKPGRLLANDSESKAGTTILGVQSIIYTLYCVKVIRTINQVTISPVLSLFVRRRSYRKCVSPWRRTYRYTPSHAHTYLIGKYNSSSLLCITYL